MNVYLCPLRDLSPQLLEQLYGALPPARMQAAARCRKKELFTAKVVGFHLVFFAARKIDPALPFADWEIAAGGKPALAGAAPQFSLSHTDLCVAVAVDETRPVGLDIEIVRPLPAKFPARFFSPAEQEKIAAAAAPDDELIRLWTAKEAVVKQSGKGLSIRDLPAIPTEKAASGFFTCGGARHALSLAPAEELPPLQWVSPADLAP